MMEVAVSVFGPGFGPQGILLMGMVVLFLDEFILSSWK